MIVDACIGTSKVSYFLANIFFKGAEFMSFIMREHQDKDFESIVKGLKLN